ncbi:MAG: hypothetical protein JW818_06915, partial [Pirellulales bacterium]|nr:hypothetical protein [Pirellulales bacterium]
MLELVLALPILLFVMALIVSFGAVAAWKVHVWSVARHSVWASRHPRSGMARPANWQLPEREKGAHGASPIAALDDPRINLPVVRGPIPGATVHDQVLDPTRGAREGWSKLHRDFPLLPSMGPYDLRADIDLLDREWQHREMGLWTTRERRMPVIYELPQASAATVDAYLAAAVAIVYAPFREDLYPLDRDPEFIYYSQRFAGSLTFPYHGAPDFHPRLNVSCGGTCQASCGLDHPGVQREVERTIKRIQGGRENGVRIPSLAERMTQAFISLYKAVQRELEAQISVEPPPPAGQISAMKS